MSRCYPGRQESNYNNKLFFKKNIWKQSFYIDNTIGDVALTNISQENMSISMILSYFVQYMHFFNKNQ